MGVVQGIVQNGVIVPCQPIPEGAEVDIVFPRAEQADTLALREEMAAWDLASDETLIKFESELQRLERESSEER